MLCARPLLRVPRGLVRHPGMENRQELAHAGRQRDFRRVASRSQALVQSFAYRVLPHRATRTHGHAGPDMGATTPTGPGAPQGPAGPINGGPSHEGRDALAVQRPPLRQVQSPGPGTHGATTWHTPEEGLVLPPDWTRAPGRVEVIVQRG